jgi:puromycin-sensitive aminopeptidase
MENLGCVTFRESALLVDPERATQGELQRVADVIHHEIAHMWFGDLVTMKWWNGIWLNEAFATFMEMKATDAFRPEWDRWTDFGISRTAAYDTDSLESTRPIEFEVVSPADAEGMFDILTYEKGAAVVRMLEQYLGEGRFREGIRRYMVEHQYGNTETTDLWDAIEAATGEPVRRIMDSWIFQGGHPVVAVATAADGSVRLSQEPMRYASTLDDDPVGAAADPRRWAVPVLARALDGAAGSEPARALLEGDELTIDALAGGGPVLVNSGGSGFFRVRYSPDDLRALIHRGATDLTPLERYNLVDDTWASVMAGTTSVAEYCDLVRGFASETDLSVWQRIVGTLGTLDRIIDPDERSRMQGFVRALVGPAAHRLGEPQADEPARTRALRAVLFEALGSLGADDAAQAEARDIVAAGATNPDSVDANLYDASVRVVAASGDAAVFDDFLARSASAGTPQDELRFLGSLADFPQAELVERFVGLTLTDRVRSQDAPYLLRRALTNRDHRALVWAFVHEHWREINERFPSNSIARLVDGIRSVTDPALAAEIEGFLAEHPIPQGAKTVAQHIERMRVSVALAERESAALAKALA